MVRELEFKSVDPGFDPPVRQGGIQFVLSLQVNACADWFVPDPPSWVRHAPKFVRTLKISSFCCKRVGLTADSITPPKTVHTGGERLGGEGGGGSCSAVLWLLAFPRESSPNSPCITLGQDNYLI